MKALLAAWKRQARRIDALTLRERAIMFASLALALVAAADSLVLSPRMAEQKALATQMRKEAAALDAMRARLAGPAADTPAERLGRALAAAQEDLRGVDADIARRMAEAGAGTRLSELLQRVLRRHERLTLLRLETLTPGAATETARPRQAVDIVMRGEYPDLVGYIADTEAALPGLRWGALKIARHGNGTELSAQVMLPGEAR